MRNLLAALTAATLLISAPALAQQSTGGSKRAEASGKVFTDKEKKVIEDYFDKERGGKPDGGDTDTKGKGKDKDTAQAEKGKDKGKGGKKTKDGDEVAEVDDDDDKGGSSKKKDKGKDKGKGKGKSDDGESTITEIIDDGDDSGNGKSKKKDKGKSKAKSGGDKGKSKQMPPGLAKRDDLPPGLAMQLERNGTLPPGLAKRDFPSDLDNLLPTRRGGLDRLIVEDDVVLIDRTTGVIMDILDGAARGRSN
jgi:hypothetical protein